MEAQVRRLLTPEEYFELSDRSEEKLEYYQGEVFAMAGGSLEHSALQFNAIGILRTQLRGRPCRGFTSDFRVFVEPAGLYTYPDLTVVCGEAAYQAKRALLNPTVLFEVLSPDTEAYDRGEKFALYRQLESLQQYVLIAQDRRSVEVFTRPPGGTWTFEAYRDAGDVVRLESIGCELPLSELYEGVELPPKSLHGPPEKITT